jgi:hypothetical protein
MCVCEGGGGDQEPVIEGFARYGRAEKLKRLLFIEC